MTEILVDLLVNLLAGLGGAGLALAYEKAREVLHRRAYSKFWEFPEGKVVIVRSVATKRADPDDPERMVWMSSLFSSMTVEVIWEFLHQHRLASEMEVVGPVGDTEHLDENIVFIGGTRGNPWCSDYCDEVLESTKLPYYWYQRDTSTALALWDAHQAVSFGTIDTTDDCSIDHGLVLKIQNPWTTKSRWMYVVAGNLGAGTYGAGKFVTTEAGLRGIAGQYERHSPISFIVQCEAEKFTLAREPEKITDLKTL